MVNLWDYHRQTRFIYLKWRLLLRKKINLPRVMRDEQPDNSAHTLRNLLVRNLNREVFVCRALNRIRMPPKTS